ncbi:WXG100 family type VII secretion target [Streptomyces hainanensis]|uniref:WXG100 family type VII secretion target n=1 Tax=Streptomyces hainanensis TaxID=402648 RepID=A0A4R4SZH8_9ACTN|nr:WXG100 family type VII secretion target [Streptomyces hainanensis]TDC67962.1 hypothetical protein E1283_28070 [Streptomyces hainanensis]
MSDPNLRYSADAVGQLKSSLADVIGDLGGIRAQVSGASADTQAGWTGTAAAEAARATAEMDSILRRMTDSLENLRQLVEMSADGFTTAEQEQAAQIRAAAAGLNNGIAGR